VQKISIQKLKWIKSLHLKKNRDKESCFIIEGEKTGLECIHALPQDLLTIVCHSDHEDLIPHSLHHISYSASKKELERISKMKSPNKIFVVMNKPKELPFDSNKKSLILDHIQDPGNLGTIIRTADWFGIDQIICSPGSADIYNSKALQASMGSFLRVKVLYTELIPFIEKHKFKIAGAFLDGKPLNHGALKTSNALMLGNEGQGISKELAMHCQNPVKIMGKGQAESLNVSSAASILIHEWIK
jgi:TrmH family RNA methyltransferase